MSLERIQALKLIRHALDVEVGFQESFLLLGGVGRRVGRDHGGVVGVLGTVVADEKVSRLQRRGELGAHGGFERHGARGGGGGGCCGQVPLIGRFGWESDAERRRGNSAGEAVAAVAGGGGEQWPTSDEAQ